MTRHEVEGLSLAAEAEKAIIAVNDLAAVS
jgi:hypothetical protein